MVSISVKSRAWRVLISIITVLIVIHCATVIGIIATVCVRTGKRTHSRDRPARVYPCVTTNIVPDIVYRTSISKSLDFDIEVIFRRFLDI
jgi:hypothetical protein